MTIPPRRVAWWLAPNLVALDAPAVAVVWQRFLAAQFRIPSAPVVSVVLGLVVWAVYLLDRVWDAHHGQVHTDRHQLAAAYPTLFLLAAGAAVAAGAVGCWFLPAAVVRAGAVVAVGVAAYLALVHVVAARWLDVGGKELLVGVGFAAGVAVPLIAGEEPPSAWLPAVAAFGLLCWLNCRLIDRWESHRGFSLAEGALAAAGVATAAFAPDRIAFALAAATALLLAVHVCLGRHRPRAARLFADAALLTPLAAGV